MGGHVTADRRGKIRYLEEFKKESTYNVQLIFCPGSGTSSDCEHCFYNHFKQAFHTLKPSNVATLKQLCKEWAKIPPQPCERLTCQLSQRLIAVVAAKGDNYFLQAGLGSYLFFFITG